MLVGVQKKKKPSGSIYRRVGLVNQHFIFSIDGAESLIRFEIDEPLASTTSHLSTTPWKKSKKSFFFRFQFLHSTDFVLVLLFSVSLLSSDWFSGCFIFTLIHFFQFTDLVFVLYFSCLFRIFRFCFFHSTDLVFILYFSQFYVFPSADLALHPFAFSTDYIKLQYHLYLISRSFHNTYNSCDVILMCLMRILV